jgi:hypothetical protein
MTRMISFYNDEVFAAEETPDYKPSKDKTKISWVLISHDSFQSRRAH